MERLVVVLAPGALLEQLAGHKCLEQTTDGVRSEWQQLLLGQSVEAQCQRRVADECLGPSDFPLGQVRSPRRELVDQEHRAKHVEVGGDGVTRDIGTVGDALDNALAESFVDSYKTELISDRVWRSRAQLELATVAWVAWFNRDRLHGSLGDIPPVEFEQHHAAAIALNPSISVNRSVAATSSRAANGLRTRRLATGGVDFLAPAQISPLNALVARSGSAQAAPTAVNRPSTACGLSDLRLRNMLADRTIQLPTKTTTKPT